MNTINVKIIDTGIDKYRIEANTDILGRRYDNNAVQIIIERPELEYNNILIAHITNNNGQAIDNPVIIDNKLIITNVLSQNPSVNIGFSFSNDTGYLKNSEIKRFIFLPANKPDGYITEQPQITKGFFSKARRTDGQIEFLNRIGTVLSTVELNGGATEATDHAKLTNLEYANSGHSGFASSNDISLLQNNVSALRTDINALQAEATAKWILLNTVDNRSRSNELEIRNRATLDDVNEAIQQAIGQVLQGSY